MRFQPQAWMLDRSSAPLSRPDRIRLLGRHTLAILLPVLPVAYRPAIDVDEIGARIVADAATLQAHRGLTQLRQAAALRPQIDRHSFDVITMFGDALALQIHSRIGHRRAIATDDQKWIRGL